MEWNNDDVDDLFGNFDSLFGAGLDHDLDLGNGPGDSVEQDPNRPTPAPVPGFHNMQEYVEFLQTGEFDWDQAVQARRAEVQEMENRAGPSTMDEIEVFLENVISIDPVLANSGFNVHPIDGEEAEMASLNDPILPPTETVDAEQLFIPEDLGGGEASNVAVQDDTPFPFNPEADFDWDAILTELDTLFPDASPVQVSTTSSRVPYHTPLDATETIDPALLTQLDEINSRVVPPVSPSIPLTPPQCTDTRDRVLPNHPVDSHVLSLQTNLSAVGVELQPALMPWGEWLLRVPPCVCAQVDPDEEDDEDEEDEFLFMLRRLRRLAGRRARRRRMAGY